MTYETLYEDNDLTLTVVTFRHPPPAGKAKGSQGFGYEVIDKRTGRFAYINGEHATALAEQIDMWRRFSPTDVEVSQTLSCFASVSFSYPISFH